MQPYATGDIVLADIPDPDGKLCDHIHPAMVLKANATDSWLIGISTKFSPSSLPAFWFRLPVSSATGLTEDCVLKCNWTVPFPVSRILRKIGDIPVEILEAAEAWLAQEVALKKAANQIRQLPS